MPTPPPTDDQALIASCQSGRLQDFDVVYQRHVRPIFAFIYRRTLDKQLSEDITSTVFLKAIENVASYSPRKGSVAAWLFGIARNALIDHYRSRKPHADIETVWGLASDADPVSDAGDKLSFERLKDALSKLDAAKREIVMLRIWEGLSYADIAAITGKSEAGCKMAFSRIIAQLRKDLPLHALILFLAAGEDTFDKLSAGARSLVSWV